MSLFINGKLKLDVENIDGLERVLVDSGVSGDALIGGDKSTLLQGIETTDIQVDRSPASLDHLTDDLNPDWTFPGTYDLGMNITLGVSIPDEATMDLYIGYYNINATSWLPIIAGGIATNPDWLYGTYDICTDLFTSVTLTTQTDISPDYIGWSNIHEPTWSSLADVGDWPIAQAVLFDGGMLTDEPIFVAKGDEAVAIGYKNYIYPNEDGPVPYPEGNPWEWPAKWNAVLGFQNWTAGQATTVIGNNNIVEKYWSCAFGDHNHTFDFASRAFGAWNILKGGDCMGVGFRINTYGWLNQGFGYRNDVHGWNNFIVGSNCITREADGVGIYDEPDELHNRFNHLFGRGLDVKGNHNNTVGTDNTIVGDNNYVAGLANTVTNDDCIAIGNGNTITASGAFVIGNDITNDISGSAEYGPNNENKIAIRSDGRFIHPGMNAVLPPDTSNLPVGHFSYWYDPDGGANQKPILYVYVNELVLGVETIKRSQIGGEFEVP